jgi:hypothetical protein
MEIGNILSVQSVERTADRQANGNASRALPTKPRHQFSRVLGEDDEVIYRVVDEETGTILTQVPSEEVLRVAKRLQQMLSDRKAK